jgi:tRNA dimethylallyltransferase
VGKSEIALDIAKSMDGEIFSADSMQIYKGLDIGTAKPSKEEQAEIPHHMIDIVDPGLPRFARNDETMVEACNDEKGDIPPTLRCVPGNDAVKISYSAAMYKQECMPIIKDIIARGKLPVICGGSTLHIHSLLYDMDFAGESRDMQLRERLEKLADEFGNDYIYDIFKNKDPVAAERIHPNNKKRIIRAIERAEIGTEAGDGLREFSESEAKRTKLNPKVIILTRDREELIERIDARVDKMIEVGLVDEVKTLISKGLGLADISMLGIGYKELVGYINKEYSLKEAVELIKIHTHQYSKRQMTWFRRYKFAEVVNLTQHT